MPLNLHLHFPGTINLRLETVTPTELTGINRKLDNLTEIMATQKEEIIAAIKAERAEFLAEVERIINERPGLPDADKEEIIAEVRGIVTPSTPPEPPAEPVE